MDNVGMLYLYRVAAVVEVVIAPVPSFYVLLPAYTLFPTTACHK